MATNNTTKPFDIAVVGGGIAGLCLTIGLLKHKIPVTLYESAAAFGEIGAGVALGTNAVNAMESIGPEVKAAFQKVATYNQWESKNNIWFDYRRGVGHGAHSGADKDAGMGELIYSVKTPRPSAYVHRARFLDELVKLVPDSIAKFGKRLSDIEYLSDGNVRLKFHDGTEAVHSAAIGCDGIKSRTRQVVLGETNPAAKAVFSGKYAYRGLIPMDQAAELLGDELARNSQMYLGYHGHVLTFPVEKGKTMNVVAFASKPSWDDPSWVVSTTKDDLRNDFAGWSSHVQSIITLMQKTDIWALFNHLPAKTYVRDRIAIIGDAAHATTPHQGSGAGMAIEDAYVLAEILGGVASADHLHAAFKAYEQVRIERTHGLVTTSRACGQLYDFELNGIEDNVDKIAQDLSTRMDWIWNEDLQHEVAQAKATFEKTSKL
ncbi:hypothetical protein IWX49DRAFT_333252 [Phyllosticta citricarpa]|uniref:FAD-binding domain-containing protein n=2 Tax=Phyllosticta TaxID=121621 RepID=A0ABR1MFF8_9PEZI